MERIIVNNRVEFDFELKKSGDGRVFKLSNLQFEYDFEIINPILIDIVNCVFKKRLTISGTVGESSRFENVDFNDVSDFNNFTFEKKAVFNNCNFYGEVRFHNTKFKKLADFYCTTFYKRTIFFKTDFDDRAAFAASEFKENVLFTYTAINNHFILRSLKVCKGIDLSTSLISGNINQFGFEITNYESVDDIPNEVEYDKAICVEGKITHKNKRETFRILKKELQNQGNAIDALKMAALEKTAYYQQLKSEKKNKIGKWYRRLQNQFILQLGKWSNSHGESWSRGVGFTFGVGLFFFYLSIISTERFDFEFSINKNTYVNFDACVKYYFEFLLPTHSPSYLEDINPGNWQKVWDLLGRVFVSFGIYQTVVAFRKFNFK